MKVAKKNSTPIALRPWFIPVVFGVILTGSMVATLAATGDPRCLVVKCVVVK